MFLEEYKLFIFQYAKLRGKFSQLTLVVLIFDIREAISDSYSHFIVLQ